MKYLISFTLLLLSFAASAIETGFTQIGFYSGAADRDTYTVDCRTIPNVRKVVAQAIFNDIAYANDVLATFRVTNSNGAASPLVYDKSTYNVETDIYNFRGTYTPMLEIAVNQYTFAYVNLSRSQAPAAPGVYNVNLATKARFWCVNASNQYFNPPNYWLSYNGNGI
jgi:hypothetical protein